MVGYCHSSSLSTTADIDWDRDDIQFKWFAKLNKLPTYTSSLSHPMRNQMIYQRSTHHKESDDLLYRSWDLYRWVCRGYTDKQTENPWRQCTNQTVEKAINREQHWLKINQKEDMTIVNYKSSIISMYARNYWCIIDPTLQPCDTKYQWWNT